MLPKYQPFRIRRTLTAIALAFSLILPGTAPAFAADTPTILRDSELERIIRDISVPIFAAAGLNTDSVHTYVIRDKSINAFVAGGQNVFINTGLIMAASNVGEVAGVIAHETGHITGGHLARFQDGLKGASALTILGMILGAAAIAAGGADAGIAVIMGSQQMAMRSVLSYSRNQEAAADQAAMTFLDKAHQSGRGLVSFFEVLSGQELLYVTNQDPYVRSHPLTQDRINALSELVDKSPWKDAPSPAGQDAMFERMKAKLWGYLQPPYTTLQQYPVGNNSLPARYARAYAYNQLHDEAKAYAEADSLLKDNPNDPYLWELKGFLLFENGKLEQSIAPFRKSIAISPDEPLILTQLGQSLIATENPAYTDEAIRILEKANRLDKESPFAWHQLSIAYDHAGKEGPARLAAAERYSIVGASEDAYRQARQAVNKLPRGTPDWFRAQDIMVAAQAEMPKGKAPRDALPD
ncbi:M48 family metalloprotease [Govanella unica]|uniref:M48 family metalloprotease n=1 Tax=Govanella unica TaxID=2975056 RepID=A0A9X3TY60_9PROT|nr:M48 family metalloprotease [Govania unica]MDA5193537.1 M48 family metalloprotease [Govania unica]